MVRMTPAKLLESGNILTPPGRMLYPSLFVKSLARGETDENKAKYQCSLLFPAGADLTAMMEAAEECREENCTKAQIKEGKIKMPFLKTADQNKLADMAEEYPVLIRCSATYKPDVRGPSVNVISEEDAPKEVYMGRWARLTVNPYKWTHPTGGLGVSLGLQNVQLLDHDDPIAGGGISADHEFEPVASGLEDLE